MIIAIDGPAGSGKSTTARAVAEAAGFAHLDTGAMYRTAGLALQRAGLQAADRDALSVLDEAAIDIEYSAGTTTVFLDGDDVSRKIREPEIGSYASEVATLPELRKRLLEQQRTLIRKLESEHAGVVVEGRDIGTIVVPDATLKFFMTASLEARARRRIAEERRGDENRRLEDVIAEMKERDERDSNRTVAPLVEAEDAVRIDTTMLSVADQVQLIINQINQNN